MYSEVVKWVLPVVILAVLGGCAARPEPTAQVDAPKAINLTLPTTRPVKPAPLTKTTGGDKVDLPVYPGSTLVQGSELTNKTDESVSYGRKYTTPDSPAKVAEFYRKEGGKLGKLVNMPNTSSKLKTVVINRPDGRKSQVMAMELTKGSTAISMFTEFSDKP